VLVLAVLAVLTVLATALGACGQESEEDKAKATVEDYLKAVTDGDGDAACKLVTPQTKARIERGGRSCATTISSLNTGTGKAVLAQFKKAEVKNVKVTGDTATASIRVAGLSQSARLRKQGGDWKLDSGAVNSG
jgi:Domain of unknown function (DUF4878)